MFKRKFKNEFEFYEDSFMLKGEDKSNDFDRSIFVVYEKSELLEFLKIEKKEKNVMVCLFNRQLYSSLVFLEEIKNFILIDASKTRAEIFKDLSSYFENTGDLINKFSERRLNNVSSFENLQKALFYMM